jgi:hypothetical protein
MCCFPEVDRGYRETSQILTDRVAFEGGWHPDGERNSYAFAAFSILLPFFNNGC